MNIEKWVLDLKEKRIKYGVSKNKLATSIGITREYLSKIENGKTIAKNEVKKKLIESIKRLNPESPFTIMIDYIRIRFPTTDVKHVVNDIEKGVLIELKGQGCRQFENFLLAQHRSWYDFLLDALIEGGVMNRLDLAINMVGILDIKELTEKCNNEECISIFRSFKSYRSGELVKNMRKLE